MRRSKEEQSHAAQTAAIMRETETPPDKVNRSELARLLGCSRKTAQDSVKKVADRQQEITDSVCASIGRVWGRQEGSRLGEIELEVTFLHPGRVRVELLVKQYCIAYRRDFGDVFADPDQRQSHDCDLAIEVGILLGILEVVATPALKVAKSKIPALWESIDLSKVSHDPS